MKKAIERFPHLAHQIGRLADQSETFRSLCEDYQLAVEALDTLVIRRPHDDKVIGEYRALVGELEADIEAALKNG
ncbi:hypothetical protein FFK22_036155 [Mycobacterium sp. KBS0706]|nr:hypothetical protein FFK22_036155 [Mycobacterium sp. KBS0706]